MQHCLVNLQDLDCCRCLSAGRAEQWPPAQAAAQIEPLQSAHQNTSVRVAIHSCAHRHGPSHAESRWASSAARRASRAARCDHQALFCTGVTSGSLAAMPPSLSARMAASSASAAVTPSTYSKHRMNCVCNPDDCDLLRDVGHRPLGFSGMHVLLVSPIYSGALNATEGFALNDQTAAALHERTCMSTIGAAASAGQQTLLNMYQRESTAS